MENNKTLSHKSFWQFEIIEFAEANTPEKGIVGVLKFEKLNVLVREELRKNEISTDNWDLIRNFRGPTEPGLSRMLDKYQKLNLIELQKLENKTIKYILTERGRNFKHGWEKYLLKINPAFSETKENIRCMLSNEIHKSGKRLVESSDEIKNMKKELLGKKI